MSKTKVLLATDGSPASLRAAQFVGDMARKDPEMHVTVLHVAHIPRELTTWAGIEYQVDVPLDAMIQRSAQPIIESAREALGLDPERVAAEVQVGVPAEEIVEMANSDGDDFIVMGSRGLSPIAELLLGSVSERVIRISKCPVLIVK